jgi:hypothetical protein
MKASSLDAPRQNYIFHDQPTQGGVPAQLLVRFTPEKHHLTNYIG